jgi:hypothetical protein
VGTPGAPPVGHGPNETYYVRYGLNRRLDVGVGYWADPGKPRPAFNWQAAREQQSRPAVLIGYGAEPMGEWHHDGAYLSLIKGFGGSRRTQAFAAYFREIDGETNHLIGGVSHTFSPRWSFFAGRYPFNSWHTAVTYQLPSGTQLGLWAHDVGRSPRLGFSVGVGWQVAGRSAPAPIDRSRPEEAKQPKSEEETALAGTAAADPTGEPATAPAPEPAEHTD